jgi:16S rRNA (guanine966-N2)-methyltransferase
MTLRIIAGERRGARIEAPPGMETRPLRDRLRQALFNILRPRLRGAVVLDAFAGSGAVGLEALSNGAVHATFVDTSPAARAVLAANIAKLRYADRTRVLAEPMPAALAALPPDALPIDLLFLMPPYHSGLATAVLQCRELPPRLAPGALAIAEIHAEETMPIPTGWQRLDRRSYGITVLELLERET